MKLTIDRNKWYRGKGSDYSRLLVSATTYNGAVITKDIGRMCCLGFYSLACGLDKEDIENIPYPCAIKAEKRNENFDWLLNDEKACQWAIAKINDNENLTGAEREEQLTKIFAEHDVQVEFIN